MLDGSWGACACGVCPDAIGADWHAHMASRPANPAIFLIFGAFIKTILLGIAMEF
jgi:hypothetical protein